MSDISQVKGDLVPYTSQYSREVRSWIESEQTLYEVCRSREHPPREDLVDTWQREDVTSYLLFSNARPVAYGELWYRKLEREIEMIHLLVDPYLRGQGYGTRLLELLYDRVCQRQGVVKAVIHLFTENEEALGCYLKAGFELVGTTTGIVGLRMIRVVTKNEIKR